MYCYYLTFVCVIIWAFVLEPESKIKLPKDESVNIFNFLAIENLSSYFSVVKQSERHLDKITNVDEFIKRIFSVIHSNDPIARALTLRTLGAVASIIPERRQAHHNIRSALDSQDSIELRAAIYSASRFAARSKCFAVNMCEKISDMFLKTESSVPS